MLVFSNQLFFQPTVTRFHVCETIARWISKRSAVFIDFERFYRGIPELRFKDNSVLQTRSTSHFEDGFPFLLNASFSHSDETIPGRRWFIEFGIRQSNSESTVECTVLLQTSERSVLHSAPVPLCPPGVMRHLSRLGLAPSTPGHHVRTLDLESAPAAAYEIDRIERRHPLVLVSPDTDGNYAISPQHLRTLLIGLADVAQISPGVDPRTLSDILGGYLVFDGAARIIWPRRYSGDHNRPDSRLIRSDIDYRDVPPGGMYTAVLAYITDHANVPLSLRHITAGKVNEAVLRARLASSVMENPLALDSPAPNKSNTSDSAFQSELEVYKEILDAGEAEHKVQAEQIENLWHDLGEANALIGKLQSQNAGLEKRRQARVESVGDNELRHIVRANISGIRGKAPMSLVQALELIQHLYPDRVVVLQSAMSAAKHSDSAKFIYVDRVFELLLLLAGDYWENLAGGGSAQTAKACFGADSFSATEAWMSTKGKQDRTFIYRGENVLMLTHLKVGVKDSLATTCRIHYEWFSDDQKIVIGHCGKHLNP